MANSKNSDQDDSGDEAKKISEPVKIHYQDAIEELRFLKRQEWRVTNYVLIVFAAIFAINKEIEPAKLWEFIALTSLTVVAAGVGLFYLWSLQNAAQEVRNKLQAIYKKYFSKDDRCHLRIDPDQARTSRGPAIGHSLMGVIFVGMVMVLYFLARSRVC